MTNPRTRRLVARVAELYPEFKQVKPEWWKEKRVCPKCRKRETVMTTWGGGVLWCFDCDGRLGIGRRSHPSAFPMATVCTAPDFTDRRNLAELCDVCAFLKLEPWKAFYLTPDAIIHILLRAAEAALGLGPWEEVARG